MYLDHFGLSQPPFKITPNTEFFYAGGNRGAILDALLYGITSGEGIIKVTGEIGSGKTMLCRMVGNLLPENVDAIFLVNPSLSRDEILYTIAEELGLGMAGQRISMVLRELQRHLIERYEQGHQVVAFLDEAQAIPLDSLEEIRLLSNLETSHHKLLQIVLFGQPELDESLKLPRMRQLKERITHSFIIPPFSKTDIAEYLMFRMRAAGYRGPEIFDADAIKLIAAASQGITRRINVLADKALLSAFAENTHEIQSRHMKAAIADSEFNIAAPSHLPLKKIGFAIILALVGVGLGVGWQRFTSMPPAAVMATPALVAETAQKSAVKAAQLPTVQSAPTPELATPDKTLVQQNKSGGEDSSRTSAHGGSTHPQSAATLMQHPPQAAVKTASQPTAQTKPSSAPPATPKKLAQTAITTGAPPVQQGKSADDGSPRNSTHSEAIPPEKADALTPSPSRQQMDATRAWLTSRDAGHYTIQLLTLNESYSPPQITQILDNHKKALGLQDVYIYSVYYPANITKRQFRIILGSFSSREQAIATIAKLPASYKANQPFRRTIKGVRDEVEQQPN